MKFATKLLLMMSLVVAGCQGFSAGKMPSEADLVKIELGASKQRVLEILGKPYSSDYFRRLKEEVWRYPDVILGGDVIFITFDENQSVSAVQVVPFVEPQSFSID